MASKKAPERKVQRKTGTSKSEPVAVEPVPEVIIAPSVESLQAVEPLSVAPNDQATPPSEPVEHEEVSLLRQALATLQSIEQILQQPMQLLDDTKPQPRASVLPPPDMPARKEFKLCARVNAKVDGGTVEPVHG